MSNRLEPCGAYRSKQWLNQSGYDWEYDFWKFLSGQSSGTVADHINHYLGKLGYTGCIDDRFRKFLRDQTGLDGTTYDMATKFFETLWNITTERIVYDGENIIYDGEQVIK